MDETSGMTESERRREMRRRRILANQGQRMNKVMGIASADGKRWAIIWHKMTGPLVNPQLVKFWH